MKPKSPAPADLYAGQQLKRARLDSGLTQQHLAKAFGITFQQIQKYERGTNRLSVSRLDQACQLLKVEPGYFFVPSHK